MNILAMMRQIFEDVSMAPLSPPPMGSCFPARSAMSAPRPAEIPCRKSYDTTMEIKFHQLRRKSAQE